MEPLGGIDMKSLKAKENKMEITPIPTKKDYRDLPPFCHTTH
jgi:inhibitor of KinA sporulation pathway (predicted exonuclease)